MLKLSRLTIKNFKSIENISLDIGSFTCIVGMNGAGKSTILQALDFVSQLMFGDMDDWLAARNWEAKQLLNKRMKSNDIAIEAEFFDVADANKSIVWNIDIDGKTLQSKREQIHTATADNGCVRTMELLSFARKKLSVTTHGSTQSFSVMWDYSGSVISSITDDGILNSQITAVRDYLRNIASLELLSPAVLKKRSRIRQHQFIGIGGENLAGVIAAMDKEDKDRLIHNLKSFYPNLTDIKSKTRKGGWIELEFVEAFSNSDKDVFVNASHINDGLLRILAVLAQKDVRRPTSLLLDEIENGINQEIMKELVTLLSNGSIQTVTTTHSPILLNYLDDETAKFGVYFCYKTDSGNLGLRRFFAIIDEPELLDYAGPGEIYANTDLSKLAEKCREMDKKDSETAEQQSKLLFNNEETA